MVERVVVVERTYRDSVSMMSASQSASRLVDVDIAMAVSATPLNLELLQRDGFSSAQADAATPADLVIAVRARDANAAEDALETIRAELRGGAPDVDPIQSRPPRSLAAAARRRRDANLAVVSVPGDRAAYECATALEAGLNVFCFSSGFDVGIEAALKRRARELDLLLMGPDCGTAILDGVGIGFANEVQRGPVGIVAASGTGAQQISCLLGTAGVGISELIGVGGRDLSGAVGGVMSAHAISMLGRDPRTECVVVVGKSPDANVASALAHHLGNTGKRAVLAMPEAAIRTPAGVETAGSLESAAVRAAELVGATLELGDPARPPPRPGATRGLFCGGTLRDEALAVFAAAMPDGRRPLAMDHVGGSLGGQDAFIDFGSESLTRGRPHPMIDPGLRDEELARHAADEQVGVILADVVLGRCAHPDPAAGLVAAIESAVTVRGPDAPAFVVSLCGAERDPQGLDRQATLLAGAGAAVARSNAQAARIALGAAGVERVRTSGLGER